VPEAVQVSSRPAPANHAQRCLPRRDGGVVEEGLGVFRISVRCAGKRFRVARLAHTSGGSSVEGLCHKQLPHPFHLFIAFEHRTSQLKKVFIDNNVDDHDNILLFLGIIPKIFQ
jgi:hypothetical protein